MLQLEALYLGRNQRRSIDPRRQVNQMKRSWTILALLLLLIVSVGILIYILAFGVLMSVPWLLLLWALIFGILALVGDIAWVAGWLPRKKKS
jgi:uncharacterized membrane protein